MRRKCVIVVTEIRPVDLLQWRDRLDRVDNSLFTSNHKIVTYHLQVIFVTREHNEIGFYAVVIGRKPAHDNLIGQMGMSSWMVAACIDDLSVNGFLKKLLARGTPENNYMDTKLYLKPTSKWKPELFKITEKSNRRKRIARCPHCMISLAKGGYQYVCKGCGSIFEEPFFSTEND